MGAFPIWVWSRFSAECYNFHGFWDMIHCMKRTLTFTTGPWTKTSAEMARIFLPRMLRIGVVLNALLEAIKGFVADAGTLSNPSSWFAIELQSACAECCSVSICTIVMSLCSIIQTNFKLL